MKKKQPTKNYKAVAFSVRFLLLGKFENVHPGNFINLFENVQSSFGVGGKTR